MLNLAPIVIFAYNRLDVLKETISSLQNNFLAKDSALIVYSDGAKSDNDFAQVQKVREYAKSISGFKAVNIIERSSNFGLAKNIIDGVSYVIEKYEKVIVLEDDLITSENFLSFMNEALDFYENKPLIYSISGYTPPIKPIDDYQYDSYLSLRPSSWGWATWKNRWNNVDWELNNIDRFLNDKKARKNFNKGGADLTRMLEAYLNGENNSWAIRWAFDMYKNGKYCIYPVMSKVQNIGFGGTGTHCKGINIYRTNLDDTLKIENSFVQDLVLDKRILKSFKYQFSYQNKFLKRIANYVSKER